MTAGTDERWVPSIGRPMQGVAIVVVAMIVSACTAGAAADTRRDDLEEIYVLRSTRERQAPTATGCAASVTGFEPFPADAERFFSFWSVRSRPADGRVVDAQRARVAELRGCFGATSERARQNFYADVRLGEIAFRGRGECLALVTAAPEEGLIPVRCQLILTGLPAPFVGGVLTTNTLTSGAPFGGETDPPGYTQASIATIRLWKRRVGR